MTPGATAGFRAFLKLSDIANGDEPEAVFSAMARIAAWSYRQTKESNPALDELLTPLSDQTSLWMGLLLHLATIDFHFFHLAKRMAARTLVRHDPPAKRYREMAAALLVSDPPSRRKPKLATHVALIIGVTVGRELGWKPTEANHKLKPREQSGCGKMAVALARFGGEIDYSGIEKVWKAKEATLLLAGFSGADVSAFFQTASPMK